GEQPPAARRQDRYGDDLPPGATARMGTVRWRHNARISALAFAPQGQLLVSAGADKVIRFWDGEGKVVREIKADSAVECLAFSPDGKTLAAGHFDRTIRLWDAASTEMTRKLVGLKNSPIQLTFSPDGKVLASACDHDIAHFWEVSTGKEISKI